MKEPLSPKLEAKALELATRIQLQSSEIVLQLARELVTTTDATLFGATEFRLRDEALKMVGVAYNEQIGQKKRLRRSLYRLPALPQNGWLPQLPQSCGDVTGRSNRLVSGLLLLPLLW